jgi:outer membrane protein OmpA-like peptidoglycan-associated protein
VTRLFHFTLAGLLAGSGCAAEPDEAPPPDAAPAQREMSSPIPIDSSPADGSGGDDLAGMVLGRLTAEVTGTGECAARVMTAPPAREVAAAPDSTSTGLRIESGLRITLSVAKPDGDYETFLNVASVDEEGFDLRAHWPSLKKTATRRMLWDDMARAPCFALNLTGESAVRGPGLTWLFLSRTLLAELKAAGEVQFGLANENLSDSNRFVTYMGTLYNVGSDSLALVLDDSLVHMPVIVARAEVRHGDAEHRVELHFLDDPSLPLVVQMCCLRSSDRVVRIERVGAERIARALSETGQVTVYGIYFDFGSAVPAAGSESVLDEIAEVMRTHPDWRLRVVGHTDGIGEAAANLELSRSRAAAVRSALIERVGADAADRLDTAGFGEGRPRADNETLEGRAANRRVELIRHSSQDRRPDIR